MATPEPAAGLVTAAIAALDLVAENVLAKLSAYMDGFAWVEDEIDQACRRHPQHADRLWHLGLPLFTPTHQRMDYDLVYRSHCRELLERVVAGEDTRPGTAAELACSMRDVSVATPLESSGVALYMRVWRLAGLPEFDELTEASRHYEDLNEERVAGYERTARELLAVAERQPPVDIECDGYHLGIKVNCSYVRATQLTLQY